MKNLVFLGPPGSGKGTQASKLVSEESYSHLSTGDLLRSEIAKGTELGKKVKSVLDAGELVSDDLVIDLILANADFESGKNIFDGYPRNLAQAETLDNRVLKGKEYKAVFFEMDTEVLVERLKNRRVCKDCNAIYNLKTNPPRKEGVCDKCGGELYQRKDDKEDVIRNRMSVYNDTILPVLEYYENKQLLEKVQADASMDSIFKALKSIAN